MVGVIHQSSSNRKLIARRVQASAKKLIEADVISIARFGLARSIDKLDIASIGTLRRLGELMSTKIASISVVAHFPDGVDLHVRNLNWFLDRTDYHIYIITLPKVLHYRAGVVLIHGAGPLVLREVRRRA